MGVFAIREEPQMKSGPVPSESTDAWKVAWPQSPEDFEKLVEAYLQPLIQYAFHRLGNIHDAEDVVQEVFVRSYARRFECARVSPVAPYLYRMTANACTDVLRKRKYSGAAVGIHAVEELSSARENASELCAAADEVQRAEQLLGRIPGKQAEAIRLRVFEGLRVTEIADVLGCSANTISSRLRYGFERLRVIVSREWKQ